MHGGLAELQHVVIRYAGKAGDSALWLRGADFVLADCEVAYSLASAVEVSSTCTVENNYIHHNKNGIYVHGPFYPGNGPVEIKGNRIEDNEEYPVHCYNFPIPDIGENEFAGEDTNTSRIEHAVFRYCENAIHVGKSNVSKVDIADSAGRVGVRR